MSPGATNGWVTILLAVEVPLVTKYVCRFDQRQLGQQVLTDRDVALLQGAVGGWAGEAVGGLLQPAPGVAPQLPDTVVCT